MSVAPDCPLPGALIRVGADLGVVVDPRCLDGGVPDDHLAVWYGEEEAGQHRVRTVPAEYCRPVPAATTYH